MGKWCLQASAFIFYRIFVKLAGIQDRYKILEELNSGRIGSVTLELHALQRQKYSLYKTLQNMNISKTSLGQILCVASEGGKAALDFEADWLTWQPKAPTDL